MEIFVTDAQVEPARPATDVASRRALIERVRKAAGKAIPGPSAARSQDFLYNENGLPE